ncbi:MAG: hypothetical protein K2M08_01545 [Anaeroplasmataceae bacterium]|nr:hypothetical protein [Anaeroplasmataceae bacterium]
MEFDFEFKTENDKKNYFKNLKHIGEVYAVITSKGYALAQIAGLDRHGIPICRIFSELHKDIPLNIEKIICEEESYLIIIHLPSMAHWRVKQAIKLGMYEVPKDFKIPQYYRDCSSFRGRPAPCKYWAVRDYEGKILLFKDYVLNILHKKIKDNSWKKDFLKLNSASIFNGPALIEALESGFSLENWKPTDFNREATDIIQEELNL